MSENRPRVSIIIPTYNAEATIEACLSSVRSLVYDNIEVFVVDGGSTDNTISLAEKFHATILELPGSGMSQATNHGVRQSSGKYVYRIDADVLLDPQIVSESVDMCENQGYDGICIIWLPDESISFWAKVRRIEKNAYVRHPDHLGGLKYSKNIMGARFLKKTLFEQVGGYNELVPVAGEDYDFFGRLAGTDARFGIIATRETHIGEPRGLKEIIRKNFRYGCTFRQYLKNRPLSTGFKQLSPVSRHYLVDALVAALRVDIITFTGLLVYLAVVNGSSFAGLVYCSQKQSPYT
jgi:glycosyltransferase involved in cell wall biosynthesis